MRLSADGIEVRRGRSVVFADVDFAMESGEIVAVVGGNGAGKSTLLATLAGLLIPWRGTIRLDNTAVQGWSPQRLVRAGVCLVPQERRVFAGLSVRRNLELGGWVRRRSGLSAQIDAFLDRYPLLADRADIAAGSLSGGEQSLLALGRALMASPQVLLVDEPLMGLDPESAGRVLQTFRELARGGTAIAIVDHDLDALATLATTTMVVGDGTLRPLADAETR